MLNFIKRPSILWLLSEPGRAILELGLTIPISNLLSKQKSGDGHPVMVLPGFMSSARSTKILRKFISNLGYDVYDWGLGRNVGKIDFMVLLLERIEEIHQKTGQQISLVGWSLGGIFARQVAKERPELIRQVITLGTPFGGLAEPNNAEWIYRLINGGQKVKNVNSSFLDDLPHPTPVPTTSIYSKEDGIVPWNLCMEAVEDTIHQNIQVRGSHIGMGVNSSVFSIISDRLKLSKENWQKFSSNGFLNRKIFYPSL
ncbi:MAG: alpha/beta fold hydrolase [Bacteroidota bacterium]